MTAIWVALGFAALWIVGAALLWVGSPAVGTPDDDEIGGPTWPRLDDKDTR
jgi:hypothetical protein